MDASTRAALQALGPTFDLAAVHALYEPLLAEQAREGVVLIEDRAYGSHPRQLLDMYLPAMSDPQAVLVWVHGGGFIRGDKRQRANIGYWGARAGFAVVIPNYQLAPEARWPEGALDIVRVWQWLRDNAEAFGLSSRRIVLGGESAGAAHVAAATLLRRFQPPDWLIAGAVLLSGPYNPRLEGMARAQFGIATPDPRNEAYFGQDPRTWDAASIVDHIDATPFPLLIGFAERDLLQMQVQAGELFARLVSSHGFSPTLLRLREHNHFSPGFSLGTQDLTFAAPLSTFIQNC
ncbi:MAG TPA: alpha/beta hydrolase [Polyangiales bacterium]|nr:alpha/beta hydrolase [Polyangiales bacterium]